MKNFTSIRAKLLLVVISCGFVLFCISTYNLRDSLSDLQAELTESRLHSDINYIRDIIGEGEWNIRDGALYLGDTLIGDGTDEHANLEPFLLGEEKTGTFSYTFVLSSDDNLTWVGDKKTGYMQGHYLRAAGSTLGPNGESIVGTYMDKKVADILDREGIYTGPANVSGRQIYCIYETLNDEDGKIVGAIVVGRSIRELESQLFFSSIKTTIISLAAILVICILILETTSPWIKTARLIETHLKAISDGDFPDPMSTKSNDEIGHIAESINLMTESLKEKEILRLKASTDPLTGLYNRGAFEEELRLGMGVEGFKGTLFMLDLDHFKEVNDNLGHPVGDKLLVDIANSLSNIFRDGDIISRLGGDEYVCFARGIAERDLLFEKADRIIEGCKRTFSLENGDVINVTTSVGACVFPYDASTFEQLYDRADKALYRAKSNGRNCYHFFEESDLDNE